MKMSSGWQKRSLDEIVYTLRSDTESGLDKNKVLINRRRLGKNDLWQTGSPFMFFKAENGFSALGYIFMAVAAISASAFGRCNDAVFVGIAILLGAAICSAFYLAIGIVCKRHSERWIPYCAVLRGGKKIRVRGDSLVLGDIVLLSEGDRVCADLKLISSNSLAVREPPFMKRDGVVQKAAIGVALTASGEAMPEDFVYAGSMVVGGNAKAIVCAVGSETAQGKRGKIRLLSGREPESIVSLRKRGVSAGAFAMIFSFAAVAIGVFSPFIASDFIGMFLVFLAFAVSACGELVPALCCLAYYKLLRESEDGGVVIRDAAGLDYIANCDGIAVENSSLMKSDKTELRAVWCGGGIIDVGDTGGDELFSLMLSGTDYGKGKYGSEILSALEAHLSGRMEPSKYVVTVQNSKSVIEHRVLGAAHYSLFVSGGEQYFSVTGSIEEVISKCTKIRINGKDVPFDRGVMAGILSSASDMLKTSSSIIAVAVRVSPYNSMKRLSVLTSDLTFIGYIATDTPAKSDLSAMLAYLRQSRIPYFFFSDGSGEDINFARKLGIISGRDDVVSGDDPEQAVVEILSEGSRGGAVYTKSGNTVSDFLSAAAKTGKKTVFMGSADYIKASSFSVVSGEPVAGSGAYVKSSARGVTSLIDVIRNTEHTIIRLKRAYTYLLVSAVVRAVYSAILLFGIPYVYPSVILGWGLFLDAIVAAIILMAGKKKHNTE